MDEYDVTFYNSPEENTEKLLEDAITAFSNQCIGFPDVVYMEFWRRLTGLPKEKWTEIKHGAVPIQVRTPHDNDVPLQFEGITLRKDVVICARKRAIIPAPNTINPVPVVLVTDHQ
jgi:hypothetical protein